MNIMMPSEILRAAKAVIENPENWTKEVYAKANKEGGSNDHLLGHEEGATCWCSVGALQRVMNSELVWSLERRLGEAARALTQDNFETAVHYNDNRTHAEVMQMFDRAIEMAEEEEKNAA